MAVSPLCCLDLSCVHLVSARLESVWRRLQAIWSTKQFASASLLLFMYLLHGCDLHCLLSTLCFLTSALWSQQGSPNHRRGLVTNTEFNSMHAFGVVECLCSMHHNSEHNTASIQRQQHDTGVRIVSSHYMMRYSLQATQINQRLQAATQTSICTQQPICPVKQNHELLAPNRSTPMQATQDNQGLGQQQATKPS